MTPELLGDLLRIHASCVHDQEGRCPLLVSVRSLCWEINQAMGVPNEEDKGFRRVDPMCAARPLTVPFAEEDEMQMFDEEIQTMIKSDGTVEQKRMLLDDLLQSEEAENAVADFVKSWGRFQKLRDDGIKHEANSWWVALELLALADSRLKTIFTGDRRDTVSIKQYHKYRGKLIDGKRYRTDA